MHSLTIFFRISYFSVTLANNSCVFEHPIHGVIDLTSLGLRNNQPRFRDLSGSSSSYYTYSFNPCFSFIENNCRDAAVCQVSSDHKSSITLARQNSSKWTIDSSNTSVLTYTNGPNTVSISMVCSASAEDLLEVSGEIALQHYSMRLYSHCACWNGCGTPKPSSTFRPSTATPSPMTTNVIYSSACMYHDSRYGTINLRSIGNMNGTAVFKDIPSVGRIIPSSTTDNIVWSYNPCYKFSESSCHNVSGCRIDKSLDLSYPIGLQEYAYWINMNTTDNAVRSIVYPATPAKRRLVVQLICNPSSSNHQLNVIGETSFDEYTMQLSSPCACWNGCTQPKPDPEPYDWTFLIIVGSASCGVFLLFCMMITCLFCSKPHRRRHRTIIIDEKTPFVRGSVNYKD